MLSLVGWLDGLTALAIVSIGIITGIICIYQSLKLEAKLLGITGMATICAGCSWLGPAMDFLIILITGDNIEPYWLYGLLSYMWTGPVVIFGLYIGSELIAPKQKKIIVSIYAILAVIFEILLFYYILTSPATLITFPPDPHGTALLNTSISITSPVFFFMIFFLASGLIFNGFGFLSKSLQSSGELKKKFLFLSLGWILYIAGGLLDAVFDPGIAIFFIRIGTMTSIVLMYLGIRVK
ncbi:MAG: hypothetical protein ACFFAO_11785 [Candidatus Hermodarchaeota archaeon]